MSKVQRQRPGQKLTRSKEQLRVGDGPHRPEPAAEPVEVNETVSVGASVTPSPPQSSELENEPPAVDPTPQSAAVVTEAPTDPEPDPAPEPEAASEPETTAPGPPKSVPQEEPAPSVFGTPGELRAAWERSVLSARNDSKRWTSYSVALPPQVWERLEARMETDQRRYGAPNLGMNHYINAALSRVPKGAKQAAALVMDYTSGHGIAPPPMRPSGTRIHQEVQARMTTLRTQLGRVARRGLLGHLQAAAVTAMLDGLDAADAAE